MQNVRRSLAALVAVIVVPGSILLAQHPQVRQGFWIGFGLGYGSAGLSCGSGCSFNSDAKGGGGAAHLRLGGTLSPKVLLGGEVDVWTKDVGGLTEAIGIAAFTVYFYPTPASGLFLKGGVGGSSYQLRDGGTADGSGAGFLIGAGYDIRVGRNISITPVATFSYGTVGDVTGGGVAIPSVKQSLIEFGIDVTFH